LGFRNLQAKLENKIKEWKKGSVKKLNEFEANQKCHILRRYYFPHCQDLQKNEPKNCPNLSILNFGSKFILRFDEL
jgi:hypothetical protein